jgi:hypothetical protein
MCQIFKILQEIVEGKVILYEGSKIGRQVQLWWFIPIMPATQETQVERSPTEARPKQKGNPI